MQGSKPAPDPQYVYVFVRQDIPIEHQIVQSNHASMMMSSRYGFEGTPNLVLIGVSNAAALREACALLTENQIAHWSWHEPDFDFGFTSICTAPIIGAERRCIAHYKLWKPIYSDIAQLVERRPLVSLVAGSSPAV